MARQISVKFHIHTFTLGRLFSTFTYHLQLDGMFYFVQSTLLLRTSLYTGTLGVKHEIQTEDLST